MINLTITTATESATYFSIDSFTAWKQSDDYSRILGYKLINEKGLEWGNKGINAGSQLAQILEENF